jgi:hypothetical protein
VASLLVNYYTFFLLKFSLVFLIYTYCRCAQPIPYFWAQYVLPLLCPHKNTDFIIKLDSPLCIALCWPTYSSKYFWFCSKLGTHFWWHNKDTGTHMSTVKKCLMSNTF